MQRPTHRTGRLKGGEKYLRFHRVAASATLFAGLAGCGDKTPTDAIDPEEFSALLDDGDGSKLPAGAMAPPPTSSAPPRFCDNGGGGFGGFGGFMGTGSGGFGGFIGSGTGGFGGFIGSGTGGFIGMGTGGLVGTGSGGRGGAIVPGSGGVGGFGVPGTGGAIRGDAGVPTPAPGGAPGTAGRGGVIFPPATDGGMGSGIGGSASDGGVSPGSGSTIGSDGGVSSGGFIGGDGGMGTGGNVGDCSRTPLAIWELDDCNMESTALEDTAFSGINHPAFRAVAAACVPGISGQGVRFAANEDILYAPDQPDFVFDGGLTVAAWIKPDKLTGVQSIVRKRLDGTSSFVLALDGNKLTLALRLTNGRTLGVTAPFKTKGVWTHVAATYDGKEALIYINGVVVGRVRGIGQIAAGIGPIFVGNDASNRRLGGAVDGLWLNTVAAPADLILGLTCVRQAPTISLSPAMTPPTPAGTTVNFDLAIRNQNSAGCAPSTFQPFFDSLPEGLQSTLGMALTSPIASGATGHVTIPVSSNDDADPGALTFSMRVFDNTLFSTSEIASATYVVAAPTGCHVTTARELFVRDVSVVDDPIRTNLGGPATDPRTGAWTFGRLIQRLSPTAAAAPDMVESIFRSYVTPQIVNGFTIPPRGGMEPTILAPWPRTADGKLDLARAPLRLNAIVNRIDLRDLAAGHGGEARFVFSMESSFGFPLQATLILEYRLPATTAAEVQAWADAWHALGALPFPSEAYNVALQALTDKITGRGAIPSRPNGSGLLRLRTNEIDLGNGQPWQFREFNFNPTTGLLVPATVKVTPDFSFNGTSTLSDFMRSASADILLDRHSVPDTFQGKPFQGGFVFNLLTPWLSDGTVDNEVRHHMSLNTCNGCHGAETGVGFLQVFPRFAGQQASLSGFMTGTTVGDPVSGKLRTFGELPNRRVGLTALVCK